MDVRGLPHLAKLRSALARINGHPWQDVGEWIQRALPIFTAYFPEHLEHLKEVGKEPPPADWPTSLSKDEHENARRIREKKKEQHDINLKNRRGARRRILEFVDSVLLVAKEEEESSKHQDEQVLPTPKTPLQHLQRLKEELVEIEPFPWDGISAWGQGALPVFRRHFPGEFIPLKLALADPMVRTLCTQRKTELISYLNGLMAVADESFLTSEIEAMPITAASPEPSGRKVFISHAYKDRELVSELVSLLRLTTSLGPQDIYYTSEDASGPENGENFMESTRANIRSAQVVVFVLSRAYFDSQICLAELGAAWALSTSRPLLLLIPPISYSDLKGILSNLQAGAVNDPGKLSQFYDSLLKALGDHSHSHAEWDARKQTFIIEAQKYIAKQVQPRKITTEEYDELKKNYDDATKKLSEVFEAQEKMSQQIEALKQAKDKDQVSAVEHQFSAKDEIQRYGELLEAVRAAMEKVPQITKEVMFRKYRREAAIVNDYDKDLIREECDDKYITNRNGMLVLNEKDPAVKTALAALADLQAFLDKASQFTTDMMVQILGFAPELDNRRYWELILKGLGSIRGV